MIKAVIFDVDQTLINTGDSTCTGLVGTARKLKLRVPEEIEMRRLFGLPWRTLVCTLWPEIKNNTALDMDYFNKKYMEFDCDSGPLDSPSNTKETIDALKKEGLLLGIITSRRYLELPGILKEVGLDVDLFDYVGTHDKNKYDKPDPRVFNDLKEYLSKKNIDVDEAVYIGDAIYDYQAASGAGIQFVAFTNGAYSEDEFVDAGLDKGFIINDFDDLPKLFAECSQVEGVSK